MDDGSTFTGWKCQHCHEFVPPGALHACPSVWEQTPQSAEVARQQAAGLQERAAAALERIAAALEAKP